MGQRAIDLRDVGGEGNLASALGLSTNVVGGIWKNHIKKGEEPLRQNRLNGLAEEVARDLESHPSTDPATRVEEVARLHGISPRAVVPLKRYYASAQQEPDPEREHPYFYR